MTSPLNIGAVAVTTATTDGQATNRGQMNTAIATAVAGYYANTVPLNSITAPTGDIPMATHIFTNQGLGENPTDSASVQNIINYVGGAHNYGGFSLTAAGSPVAVTANTYVNLNASARGTFALMNNNNFAFTGNHLVYGGSTTRDFMVTIVASIQSDVPANVASLAIYRDGIMVGQGSTQTILAAATDTQITTQFIVPSLVAADYLDAYATFGTNANLTLSQLTMTVSLA